MLNLNSFAGSGRPMLIILAYSLEFVNGACHNWNNSITMITARNGHYQQREKTELLTNYMY